MTRRAYLVQRDYHTVNVLYFFHVVFRSQECGSNRFEPSSPEEMISALRVRVLSLPLTATKDSYTDSCGAIDVTSAATVPRFASNVMQNNNNMIIICAVLRPRIAEMQRSGIDLS